MSDTVTQDLRLLILRILAEAGLEPVSTSILRKEVRRWGNPATEAQFDGAVAWLDQQRTLVRVTEVGGSDAVKILELLTAGEEVATGAARYPGIARPSRRHG
jgi:hypothetical protein